MKEIINTIGTIVTVVSLVIAIVMIQAPFVRVLAGAGMVYVMFVHDELVKAIGRREAIDAYSLKPKQKEEDMPDELTP